MSESSIDSETTSKTVPDPAKPKGTRKDGKKAKPAKKAGRAKKPAGKPKEDRTNKKAEVIEMMKRAKGATLAEIMKATGGSRTRSVASFDPDLRQTPAKLP